ncbi:MAG: hypothetical protein ACR2QC_11965 [Gammaproteobacteria bacterium]
MKKVRNVSIVVAFLMLAACKAPVTHQGVAISDPGLATAAQVIDTFDNSAAVLVRFIKVGFEAGDISVSVKEEYQNVIGPDVQAALDAARDALVRAIKRQDDPSNTAYQVAIQELSHAVSVAQGFVLRHTK